MCYPSFHTFFLKAGVYGCNHEKDSIAAYINEHQKAHKGAYVEKCGLIIHEDYPFFGATPDGFIHCDECGIGWFLHFY